MLHNNFRNPLSFATFVPASHCLSLLCNPFRKRNPKNASLEKRLEKCVMHRLNKPRIKQDFVLPPPVSVWSWFLTFLCLKTTFHIICRVHFSGFSWHASWRCVSKLVRMMKTEDSKLRIFCPEFYSHSMHAHRQKLSHDFPSLSRRVANSAGKKRKKKKQNSEIV